MHRSRLDALLRGVTGRIGLGRWSRARVFAGLGLLALVAFAAFTASPGRDASAAGPFSASGLYTASFTAAFPPPINPVHSNCIFRIDTVSGTANMRAVCYTVGKTVDNSYPPAPPPPPPPYTPLVPPVGLNILSGPIDGSGNITLQFSPSLCLPVDNNPTDGTTDGGIVASLTTSVNKAGVLQPGTVQLQTDRTPPGGPYTCNDFNAPETIMGPFIPTAIADTDLDGDGCLTSAELGPTANSGGLRDPINPFDYSDINHDGAISVPVDVLGIAAAFGNPLSNPRYIDYKDRGVSLGLNAWNLGPPNGSVDVSSDVLGVARQFGNSCVHSHPAAGTAPPATRYGPHPTTLSIAVGMGGAPLLMNVANAAGFPTTGQLLVDGEILTYDQGSLAPACAGIVLATQFCVTARGTVASHASGAYVYQAQTTVSVAVTAAGAAPLKVDVGTTFGFLSAGYMRIDNEVMRYDQSVTTGGCSGLNTATQFCVTERPCDNFTDDDNDGKINDGCPQSGATAESGAQCDNDINDDPGDDTKVNDGCPPIGPAEGGSVHAVGARILPQ